MKTNKSHLFVIACYFNGQNDFIYNCVRSIKENHPESPILIVDSNSPDKSYFKLNQLENVEIADIGNQNYDTGAYWYAYKNKPNYDSYIFLQDSIYIKKPLYQYLSNSLTSIRFFISRKSIGKFKFITGRNHAFKYILAKRFNIKNMPEIDGYGFDSPDQIEWCENQLKKTSYFFPNIWNSLFGPMMICDRSVFTKLSNKGFDKILPTNKLEQMCMERLFGIALTQEGYDVTTSIQGNNFEVPLENHNLKKIIAQRK